ncbi:hypothetical protein [Burkholderia sp. AU31652]|nr:hypothetical protein [Burkholderia sp. AU31652]
MIAMLAAPHAIVRMCRIATDTATVFVPVGRTPDRPLIARGR